ncbi:MAG: 30S ribosomal protein S16 [Clostridia bacterium]|nr:30S ribosomal protein S16 [Clostridia bacterium]
MAVKMRLTRMGDKKSPFYRIVVADSRVARDAKYIDLVGTYNPISNPEEIKIDADKAQTWIKNGAQPTATVKALLVKSGVIENSKKSK